MVLPISGALKQHLAKMAVRSVTEVMKADMMCNTPFHSNGIELGEVFLFSGSSLKAVPFNAELPVGCGAVTQSQTERCCWRQLMQRDRNRAP